MGGYISEQIDAQINGQTDERIDGKTDRQRTPQENLKGPAAIDREKEREKRID